MRNNETIIKCLKCLFAENEKIENGEAFQKVLSSYDHFLLGIQTAQTLVKKTEAGAAAESS